MQCRGLAGPLLNEVSLSRNCGSSNERSLRGCCVSWRSPQEVDLEVQPRFPIATGLMNVTGPNAGLYILQFKGI